MKLWIISSHHLNGGQYRGTPSLITHPKLQTKVSDIVDACNG
ncbi:hypothetical protein [Vibrio gallaecicus]|nr:hypothetical protein [Vibrio gallaecicus]MDN3613762.1 hypothetical protein [Vibrio gallaecicus]